MSTTAAPTATSTLRGGEWLLQPSTGESIFTPEKLTDEHRLIKRCQVMADRIFDPEFVQAALV